MGWYWSKSKKKSNKQCQKEIIHFSSNHYGEEMRGLVCDGSYTEKDILSL